MENENGKFNSRLESVRRFLHSDLYTLCFIILCGVFIFTDKGVLGVVLLALVCTVTMVLTDDLLPAFEGMMLISCFAIRLKYSTGEFLKLWPFIFPIAICFFSHFFIYHRKLKNFGILRGMIAASFALVLGGVGVINPRTYFSPTSIFYMISLGFGMVIICCYVADSFESKKDYDFENQFCKMMVSTVIVITLCLIYEYLSRRNELADHLHVIPFQWRNNGSTLLMLAMPFVFYYSRKHFIFYILGILVYGEILLTGSRGGLIFGAAELFICIAVMIILDKKHRKAEIITIIICVFALIVSRKYFFDLIQYTIDRMLNPEEANTRIELYRRGIADFKFNPVNGRGIAYMGNRDVHPSAEHTLCWYHNSILQVAASMGIIGIAAYVYLNILRIKVFLNNVSFFSLTMFLSFIGLEMMSLVNPGIFAPFPYLMLVSIYFIVIEKQNKNGRNVLKRSSK